MTSGREWLEGLASQMKKAKANGAAPGEELLTVRLLLERFGYLRRGYWVNSEIRNALERYDLITSPDFEVAWIDSDITIRIEDGPHTKPTVDPTHRIRSLDAANNKPTSVKPDQPLQTATTIMLLNDYSQLPVMTSRREVHGVISWESTGTRLSLGQTCEYVRDCMNPPQELPDTAPLIDAIGTIAAHGYVLVRGTDNAITGIVTASDLSLQLMQLAGPFLLIGEIEGYLRHLIHGKFTVGQLQAAAVPEEGRSIEGSGDLTLGGYYALLGKRENWNTLGLRVDRKVFIGYLDEVRRIRNETVHFNPDGLSDEDRPKLLDLARFFEKLARMGKV